MTVARLPKLTDRTSGLLLHPTCFAAGPETGDLGPDARAFVDFLAAAGQSWWQMLPVGPAGYGNSPYSAESAFAGNPMLISLDRLVEDGLLPRVEPERPRLEQLRAAFETFRGSGGSHPDLDAFRGEARGWLEDFAVYRAFKRAHGNVQWTRWPAPARDRDPGAIEQIRAQQADEIAFVRFLEWRFSRDFRALRAYAHERGVALIGDIPIFTAHDSADVWQHRDLFSLDEAPANRPSSRACRPTTSARRASAGAIPLPLGSDAARRVRLVDRAVPHDARHVRRRPPRSLHRLRPLLGDSRPREHRRERPLARRPRRGLLRRGGGRAGRAAARRRGSRCRDPGGQGAARSLQHAGDQSPAVRLWQRFAGLRLFPHNFPRNAVVYTGTHDNDTTVGWFFDQGSGTRNAGQTEKERQGAMKYLGVTDGHEIHWRMIRLALLSVANVAIIPVQDLLGLGSEARMNRPGVDRGNWSFRLAPGALTPELAARLRELTEVYGRRPAG